MLKRLTTAGAIVIAGLGAGAGSASAYSISGGAYVGLATSTHSWTIAGAYTFTCPAASTTFSGVATGADTTDFTPSYGAGAFVCSFFGLPLSVTQSGTWSLRVTSGPDAAGWYSGEIHIPMGTTTTVSIPSMGCVQTVSGPQTFTHGVGGNVFRARNVVGGVEFESSVNGIVFTASGCPFASGTSGTYTTGTAPVTIPGITIS